MKDERSGEIESAVGDNLRIRKSRPLVVPAILEQDIPVGRQASRMIAEARTTIRDIIRRRDDRCMMIVGPCSVHDVDAVLEYAARLKRLAEAVEDRVFVVMRVYFEKPRTTVGWKGFIDDPGLDETFRVNDGLRQARRLLCDIAELGLPTGTEFLDTTFGQYYTDFVSWGAIGARTVESQIHRQLASGLSMPVGIKNRTDGDTAVALDAIVAASHSHQFPSLTKEGAPALLETTGNPDCHLVMRGGTQPNYEERFVRAAAKQLGDRGLRNGIVVDCSHGNSSKDPARQRVVLEDLLRQRREGQDGLVGMMVESHLVAGRQDAPMVFGQSVTDACVGWDETVSLVEALARGWGRASS